MAERWLSRPVVLRYLGLFGAICCGIDAILFGAPSRMRLGVSVASILRGPNGVLIMLLWVAGLAALCTAWWYGRRLLGTGLLTHRWILVTAALWIVPMLFVPPLASRDMYAYACQGALFDYGLNPSVDAISAQPCPWLDSVSLVWRDTPTPYGPLFILLAGLAAAFGSLVAALAMFRVYAVLGLILLAVVLPVLARRRDVPVDRALWLVLCCPLVGLHLVGGGHNDAYTMALVVSGLAVIAGRSARIGTLVAGGALIGAAIGVKTTIGVVLPFAALLAAGRPEWAPLIRRGGAVIGGALAAMLALSFGSGLGLNWLVALSGAGASQSWTSPPTAVGIAINATTHLLGGHLDAVPAARFAGLALLPVALVVIWWRSRRGDPLPGAGLACLALVFLAPITQPWYLFWAITLFAATAVNVRWLAGAIVLSMFLILPDGDGAWKPLQVPLAILVTGLVGWVGYRAVGWLRKPEVVRCPELIP